MQRRMPSERFHLYCGEPARSSLVVGRIARRRTLITGASGAITAIRQTTSLDLPLE
jgi:hypothetical protein